MLITGIAVKVFHPHGRSVADELDDNDLQVFFPTDPAVWVADTRTGIEQSESLVVSIATTGSPDSIAIAIGRLETVLDPLDALAAGKAFGFNVDLPTLRKLRSAIETSIAAIER